MGVSYQATRAYAEQAAAAGEHKPLNTGTGSNMEWLAAVGALAGPVVGIVDAVTGTGAAKAQAATAAANAQAAATNAQLERDRLAAESTRQVMTYALIGVGVLIAGFVAYKAVA